MLLPTALLVCLQGCTGMLLGSSSGGERSSAPRTSSTQSSDDSRISGVLRSRYSADAQLSRFPIGIRASGGRVTLTGTVGSYDLRDRVVDIARNTAGVVAVDSRVVVNTSLQ